MSEPLVIREAGRDDAETISALIVSLARFFLANPKRPQDAAPFFRSISAEMLRKALASPRYRYHVALAGGTLAGVIGVRDASHLLHLFVAEPFHRQGIALRLWSTARAAALADGAPDRFTLNSSLLARPLYERWGFEATEEPITMDGLAFVPMECPADRPLPLP